MTGRGPLDGGTEDAERIARAASEVSLLRPQPTRQDALALLDRAQNEGFGAVCLPPTMFPLRGAGDQPEDRQGVRLVAVAGHPTGQHHVLVKASEAHMAIANGADEVNVVLDPAHVFGFQEGKDGTESQEGDLNALISEIVTLREAVPYPAVLKVAIGPVRSPRSPREDSDGEPTVPEMTLRTVARAAVTAGADVVVADARGGAESVRILADAVSGSSAQVMSGCDGAFNDWSDVQNLMTAGASRVLMESGVLTTMPPFRP